MKILKYIIFYAFLLNACNEHQTNKATSTSENFELQNIEEKDIIEVVDKVQSIQTINKTQAHANAGGDIIVDINETFKLNASESIGDIVGYEWKYKGYVLSDTPIISLSIKQTGSFEIILETTESNGEVSKDIIVVDVISDEKVYSNHIDPEEEILNIEVSDT